MMQRVPFYGQVIIAVVVAVGIVGVAYLAAPNLKEIKAENVRLRDDYAEKERKITEGRAIEQRLPEFEREIAALKQKLGDVQQILPTNSETGELLRWIKNLGDQSNLDLKSFSPGSLRPVEFYKEFPIEMQIAGKYHDLGLFLDRVSKYSRIINVDNLRMSKAKSKTNLRRSIQASFTATTFVYDESEVSEEANQ